MYSIFPSLTSVGDNSGIKYMKVFYDTLFLCVRSEDTETNTFYDNILIEKLDINQNNGASKGIVVKIGQAQEDYSGSLFVDAIFLSKEKKILFSTIVNNGTSVVPRLYQYFLNDHRVEQIYPVDEDEWVEANIGNTDAIQPPILQKSENYIDLLFSTNNGTTKWIHLLTWEQTGKINVLDYKKYTVPLATTDFIKDFKRVDSDIIVLINNNNTIIARKLIL